MRDFTITPTLVVILLGMLGFAYYDHDSLCASGTPSLSASVQNYINSKIVKSSTQTDDKTGNGKSLKDVNERLFKLDREMSSAVESVAGLELLKKLMPEEVFDFEDIPILEQEKRQRSLEMMDFVCARVRRNCKDGLN